jgi:putative transposase
VHYALVTFGERAYADHNVAVGRYVIMPDHIHLFVCGDAEFDLSAWFRLLKPYLGKAVVRSASKDPIWQRGFFDHVLRSDESCTEKWNYVRENPVRAGLVTAADDWPYAGEIISIEL